MQRFHDKDRVLSYSNLHVNIAMPFVAEISGTGACLKSNNGISVHVWPLAMTDRVHVAQGPPLTPIESQLQCQKAGLNNQSSIARKNVLNSPKAFTPY